MPEFIKDKAEFDRKVKKAEGKLIVVDFTASWCGPCRMIGPKFEEMSKEFTDVIFFKVDVDDSSDVAEQEGVSAMPTFKFYKNGRKIDELCGASEEKLRALITKNK